MAGLRTGRSIDHVNDRHQSLPIFVKTSANFLYNNVNYSKSIIATTSSAIKISQPKSPDTESLKSNYNSFSEQSAPSSNGLIAKQHCVIIVHGAAVKHSRASYYHEECPGHKNAHTKIPYCVLHNTVSVKIFYFQIL